jgi:type IV secretory pathway ATPase VirB11/archaellum biosynthesis ATPase
MPTEVIVAIVTFLGTCVGTLGGILVTNKIITYRIEQLEKKVDKHNNVIERMTIAEQDIKYLKEVKEDKYKE